MKILLVNKFHYLRGGSEKYYFELAKLLKEKGHEIAFFSMHDEKNIKTGEKEYFVNKIDLNTNNIFKAIDVIYSKKNKKKMKDAINEFKPDIVHLNNFQRQLSSSIINAIKEKDIPIVFTSHDLQTICPAINMIDKNGKICEKCITGRYMNCIRNKCNKASFFKSILGAVEGNFYKKNKVYTEKIDFIISPSEFYKQKFIKHGINSKKIKVLHNFVEKSEYNIETLDEGFALYVGRLSKEKGIVNLIETFKKIDTGVLYIAGEGIEKEKIEKIIKKNKLQDKIKLLGYLNEEELKEKIRRCRFVIIPSIWHENCPYSLMEALITGKPVIGTKIGGMSELIIDGKTGFLYELDNLDELTKKIEILLENKNLAMEFGKNAKEYAIKEFDRENYYHELMKIYAKLIEGAKK